MSLVKSTQSISRSPIEIRTPVLRLSSHLGINNLEKVYEDISKWLFSLDKKILLLLTLCGPRCTRVTIWQQRWRWRSGPLRKLVSLTSCCTPPLDPAKSSTFFWVKMCAHTIYSCANSLLVQRCNNLCSTSASCWVRILYTSPQILWAEGFGSCGYFRGRRTGGKVLWKLGWYTCAFN